MCAEKVESAASMDCASPMSARKAVKTGKLAAVAGMGKPAWAIMASKAVVLSVTVLPPVLGPLMMSWRSAAVSSRVSGMTLPPEARRRFSSSGWRPASRCRRSGVMAGSHAVVVAGKAGAGLQAIHQRQHARAFAQFVGIAAHLPGERHKDAMNLRLFFLDEAHQLVVLLDGLQRLDVDGLARRACAVDHAGNLPLQLRANGNDEAVAADGDEVFLGRAIRG